MAVANDACSCWKVCQTWPIRYCLSFSISRQVFLMRYNLVRLSIRTAAVPEPLLPRIPGYYSVSVQPLLSEQEEGNFHPMPTIHPDHHPITIGILLAKLQPRSRPSTEDP